MMNHYPEYKPSGVEWLGEVPTHWQIKKAGWYLSAEKGSRASELTKEYCGQNEGEFPVYSGQTGNSGVMAKIDSHEFDFGNEGVLFSTTVGAKAMHLSHIKGKFSLSQNCMIIHSPSDALFTRFYYYHLDPLFKYERGLIPDHMQASFRMEDLYEYKFALPDLMEQKAIAHFLDLETARIDNLISEKESFIQLLQEKRQVLISHVVTKGLVDNVKMKPSGVEWIGEIPEHWVCNRLKQNLSETMMYGANEAALDSNLSHPRYIRITDMMNNGELKKDSYKSLSPELAKPYLLKDGDVLLARSGATVGKAFIYRDKFGESCFAGYLIKASVNRAKLVPQFLYYITQSKFYWDYIGNSQITATIQNVSAEKYGNMYLPLPEISEQESIVGYLDIQLSKFKLLEQETKSSIELLKEHRTALISAAVTGKIDVREVA